MRISVPDLIFGFSRALDMVKPQLAGHHLGVAWIASELGQALSLPRTVRAQLFTAAMLHDAGAIPSRSARMTFFSSATHGCTRGRAGRCFPAAPFSDPRRPSSSFITRHGADCGTAARLFSPQTSFIWPTGRNSSCAAALFSTLPLWKATLPVMRAESSILTAWRRCAPSVPAEAEDWLCPPRRK